MNWNDVIKYANHGSPSPTRRVEKSDDEWKAILNEEEFLITRKKGTERAGTGELCSIYEPGVYSCKCCNEPLF